MEYKDATPNVTIKRIKAILMSLGIKTRETIFCAHNLCHSCRIQIDNKGLESLNIGTNGKGITHDYSLASGYAELMERLQNKFLVNEAMRFSSKISDGYDLPFRFFPDEQLRIDSMDDFLKRIKKMFPNYNVRKIENLCAQKKDGKTMRIEWLSVPFAQFSKKKTGIVDIPIVLARANSSTGLCAGNSPHEAILQGICEIFERYALQQIYLSKITPPSFPKDFYKGTDIFLRLEALKSFGYIYDIKDLSLGIGLPVVGLILTNTSNGTTMCRLGADMDSETALARCLTEIYQGREEDDYNFIDYTSFEQITKRNSETNEYVKSLKDGTGHFPAEFFSGKPSYNFRKPILQRGENSKEDLRNMLDFLYSHNYSIFIRDNSFLGFCAYQIIIPKLSDQSYKLRDILSEYYESLIYNADSGRISDTHRSKQWELYNIKSSKDSRHFILKHYPFDNTLKLAPYCNAPQNNVNKSLLLFLSAVKNEDYCDADIHFSELMKQRQLQGLPYEEYLSCVNNYIHMKATNTEDLEIIAWLKHFFSDNIINEVIQDFNNPNDIMRNYSFPTCFNCDGCPVKGGCHYRDAISFEKMIQTVQISNPIIQKKLFDVI